MTDRPNKFLGGLFRGAASLARRAVGRGGRRRMWDPWNMFGKRGGRNMQAVGGNNPQTPIDNAALAEEQLALNQPQVDPVAQPVVDPAQVVDPNSAVTMKKSPLEQEEKEGVLGGQEIAKQNESFQLDEENGRLMPTEQFGGEEGILINDPDDILEGAPYGSDEFDYRYKVEEDGSYTLISKGPSGGTESPSEENMPTGPVGPGGMDITGGVGGPMEMKSPIKNYKNPQYYKAFNFGNKPIPFDQKKKKRY